jgi:CheY-like chemotaxis protein
MFVEKNRVFFIADDDQDDQELFIGALQQIDGSCICLTAFDGEDAIQKLTTATVLPDIIFLDLNMPKINGKQCLANIKGSPVLQKVPVIIYSTSADQKEIQETELLGAAFFLQKPNRFTDLCTALEKIVQHNWHSAV